jgi:hypothetical protein
MKPAKSTITGKLKKIITYVYGIDEFELKFPELSLAELGRLRAEPSLGISIFELKPS